MPLTGKVETVREGEISVQKMEKKPKFSLKEEESGPIWILALAKSAATGVFSSKSYWQGKLSQNQMRTYRIGKISDL